MPQLSLYIDQETLSGVSEAARAENTSVSKIVTNILSEHLNGTWPAKFLATFGIITDPSFTRPDQPDPSDDVPRPITDIAQHPAGFR